MLKNKGLKSADVQIKFETLSGYTSQTFLSTSKIGATSEQVITSAIQELCLIGTIAGYDVKGAAGLGAAQGQAALQGECNV
jgi:hypothetical protein